MKIPSNAPTHLLYFLSGMIAPVLVIMSINTTWSIFASPLVILSLAYGGINSLLALQKNITPVPTNQDIRKD